MPSVYVLVTIGVVTIVVVSLAIVCTPAAVVLSCVVCACVNTGKLVSTTVSVVITGVAAPSAASVALPTSSSVPQLLMSAPPPAPTPVYGPSGANAAQQSRMDAKLALATAGQGNTVEANIFGDDNLVNITQAGGPSYINLMILGTNNEFESMQNMSGGAMAYNETTIIGFDNDVELIQQGTGNKAAFIHVDGTGQNINVNQKDSGEHFVDLSVTGHDHTASILQEGAGDHAATVELDGTQPWNFDLTQSGATDHTYTLPHAMSDGSSVSGTCAAVGGCNLTIVQQ